jgi:hypothetical protein
MEAAKILRARQRRAGRDRGAGLDGKPGQPERGRQDRIVAAPGNRHPTIRQITVIFAFSARSS